MVLHSRGVLLCHAAQFEEFGEKLGDLATRCPTSAAATAAALEEFEAHVRIERLNEKFLQQRKRWVQMFRARRGSFDTIVNLAWDLQGAMQTPPHRLLLVMAFKKSCTAAKRIPPPLWAMIMQMVGGTHPLGNLSEPVIDMFTGGSPQQQLSSARALMMWCAHNNMHYFALRAAGEPMALLETDVKTVDTQRRCQGCVELKALGVELLEANPWL